MYKQYNDKNRGDKGKITNNRLFATIVCIKHILSDTKQWNEFVDKLEESISKYEVADISTMGFVDDWRDILRKK